MKTGAGGPNKKLFQLLNEIGARALPMHLGRVLEMSESTADPREYERKIVSRFDGEHELDLIIPNLPSTAFPPPFEQSQTGVQAT